MPAVRKVGPISIITFSIEELKFYLKRYSSLTAVLTHPKEMSDEEFNSLRKTRVNLIWWREQIERRRAVSAGDIFMVVQDCIRMSENEPIKLHSMSENDPVKLFSNKQPPFSSQWIFKDSVYEVKGHYSDEQIRLLILEDFDKERIRFERLKRKFDSAEQENTPSRLRIPESVRIEVWRRDGGKCARCSSREKLEYDHIVPVSKGGSNTARNIELLCERCNREKGDRIDSRGGQPSSNE